MPIQLIAFDFDDTLLTPELTVSPKDLEAIAYAREKGVKIVPASGRAYASMLPYAKLFGGFDAMISTNGSQAYDQWGRRILYTPVSRELAREVVLFAKEHGCYVHAYDDETFFYEEDCEESRFYASLTGLKGRRAGDFLAMELFDTPKLLVIEMNPQKIEGLRLAMKSRFLGRLAVAGSKPMYLEITNPSANKGAALRFVAERLGVSMPEVMAIGDSDNDLPMIEAAGVGVAMGNAKPHVQQKAAFVTKSNLCSGVAHAILSFV